MRTTPLVVLLLTATPAVAQDMVFVPSMSWPEAASISQFGLLASQAREREQDQGNEPARPVASTVELTYSPSAVRRRANYAQFVNRSRRADPAGADNLAATLSSDPIAAMGPELAKVGLRTNNVADAYAVYWVEAWQAGHGVFENNSRELAQAVKRQAANAILATPSFATLSDAQKQEFGDSLLVQALLIGAAREQAQGDRAKLREIANAVRQGAKGLGLNLDAMTLTEQGFVSARETGAASTPHDREQQAVAASFVAEPGSSYGLVAAVGGVGLGAAFLLGKMGGRKG